MVEKLISEFLYRDEDLRDFVEIWIDGMFIESTSYSWKRPAFGALKLIHVTMYTNDERDFFPVASRP